MTAEEAIELLYDIQTDAVYNVLSSEKEALDMAIKALEQQPAEDAISREAVIEWLKDKDIIKTKNQEENAKRELAELPSVTPSKPRGKWIEVFVETPNDPYSYGFKSHKCSKCEHRPLQILNYCPNCGARMGESEE